MTGWIESESFGLGSPAFYDEPVRREALLCLEAAAEIISVHDVGKMTAKLVRVVVLTVASLMVRFTRST